jgi:hypothetical protein
MPKVVLSTQGLDESYRNILKHLLVDTPSPQFCKLLGISKSCLTTRRKRPELTTLRELRILRRTGRVTDEQILSIIREEK